MKTWMIAAAFLALSPMLALSQVTAPDSAEIAATVQRFHEALKKGDKDAALELLAADAVILESGAEQTREEYAREHLVEDIAFAKAVQSTVSDFAVHQEGNAAWTTSSDRTTGTFNGKPVNSAGTELVVMTKSPSGWQIRAIHWSSRKVTGDKPAG